MPVNRCNATTLEVINATAVNGTEASNPAEGITYVCREGLKFSDMSSEKTINCTKNGWENTPLVCEGMVELHIANDIVLISINNNTYY